MLIKTANGYRDLQGHYGAIPIELREPSEASVPAYVKYHEQITKAGLVPSVKTAIDMQIDWSQFWQRVWKRLMQTANPGGYKPHGPMCEQGMGSCETHNAFAIAYRKEVANEKSLLKKQGK